MIEPNGIPDEIKNEELIAFARWVSQWTGIMRDGIKAQGERLEYLASKIGQVEEAIHRVDRLISDHEQFANQVGIHERIWEDLAEEVKLRQATINQSVNGIEQRVDQSVAHLSGVMASDRASLKSSIDELKSDLSRQRTEETTLSIAKIGRTEKILVALLPILGGLVTFLLTRLFAP